ncbi:unnamed protein product [Wuchereria bancrofti]|uniref:Uncharacterized protein n=1 Tax=Wuchereria bancrofti TaxID=6293 RepID=A0A3P7FIN0_WUCBA|nr:unnamed protein product [Wuchereria bancrofti]
MFESGSVARSSSSNSRSSSSGSGNYCHSPATMDSITPRSVAYIHGRPTGIIMLVRINLECFYYIPVEVNNKP